MKWEDNCRTSRKLAVSRIQSPGELLASEYEQFMRYLKDNTSARMQEGALVGTLHTTRDRNVEVAVLDSLIGWMEMIKRACYLSLPHGIYTSTFQNIGNWLGVSINELKYATSKLEGTNQEKLSGLHSEIEHYLIKVRSNIINRLKDTVDWLNTIATQPETQFRGLEYCKRYLECQEGYVAAIRMPVKGFKNAQGYKVMFKGIAEYARRYGRPTDDILVLLSCIESVKTKNSRFGVPEVIMPKAQWEIKYSRVGGVNGEDAVIDNRDGTVSISKTLFDFSIKDRVVEQYMLTNSIAVKANGLITEAKA